jgi:hypothetical protein
MSNDDDYAPDEEAGRALIRRDAEQCARRGRAHQV